MKEKKEDKGSDAKGDEGKGYRGGKKGKQEKTIIKEKNN